MKLSSLFEYGMTAQTAPQMQSLSMPWEGLDQNDNPVDFNIQVSYDVDPESQEVNSVRVVGVQYNGQMLSQFQAERMFKANSNNPNEQLFDPQLLKDNVAEELANKAPQQQKVSPAAQAVGDMLDRSTDYRMMNPK